MKQTKNTAGTLAITGGATAMTKRYVLQAEKAAARAEEAVLHPPVPGENGTWQIWDRQAGVYVDSGENCRGTEGTSAYVLAAAGGYEDTEEQFADDLANFKNYVKQARDAYTNSVTAANASAGFSDQARQSLLQAQQAQRLASSSATRAAESAASAAAAVEGIADSGSVNASGLISFRHGTTELFTVQLPLYDGGVTYGP